MNNSIAKNYYLAQLGDLHTSHIVELENLHKVIESQGRTIESQAKTIAEQESKYNAQAREFNLLANNNRELEDDLEGLKQILESERSNKADTSGKGEDQNPNQEQPQEQDETMCECLGCQLEAAMRDSRRNGIGAIEISLGKDGMSVKKVDL